MQVIKELKTEKNTVLKYLIYACILSFIWGAYIVIGHYIDAGQFQKMSIVQDNFTYAYQIDYCKADGRQLELKGWAFKLGVDSAASVYDIVLYDAQTDTKYLMNTDLSERADVDNYFKCEYDYSHCGFTAKIKDRDLDFDNNEYQVLIRYDKSKSFYATGVYISEGRIAYEKASEHVQLEVDGTDLENIVNNGVLRVSRPDFGIFVYQYNGNLYWIADESFSFEESGATLIQYQLNTTQVDRLPQIRLDNEWYEDNISFTFEDKELTGINTGKYRVSAAALPTEYSITRIWTGFHKGQYIWKSEFRPWYEFK